MEEIVMSGAIGILNKLTSVVSEQIGLAWGKKDDLNKLHGTLDMLLAVIADAEKRQEKDEVLRLWLRRLKGIAYDADDVMDDLAYESMRRRERGDRLKHKVLDFVSSSNSHAFRFKMARKIKDINRCLDEITRDMGRFHFEITTPLPDSVSTEQLDRQNTSHVNELKIVGRENDESHIIKLLTTNTKPSSSATPNQYPENVSVVSVVGMGGLGKTTLAQLVYKDELVEKVFELKMWVHVSEIFDIEIILINIMESITETKFHRVSNFGVLVNKVQEKLSGKKYLLVLDDLWNEDSEQWGSLMSVLLAGAPGSKILVTTRNDQVASTVRGSIPPYNLSQLEDDECWSIIKHKAFSPGGALIVPKISDIGNEIAKKCCGLPLAAKFLGSLMRLRNKESDWISIRDDDIWNTPESKRKILPVLILSYNYLPPHLKQCFSYCSIFPKNWEISKESLVHLWMAEGFLKQSNSKRSIEDSGRDYFESLARSSFFYDFNKNELGDIETCKMHDLVHDLAQDVVGENELLTLKVCELKDVSKVRRLQLNLHKDISATFLRSLSNLSKLRTLFIPEGSNLDTSIFSEINHLRILHVGNSPNPAPPKWCSLSSKLKHLRYLRLTSLDVREVDQSISRLYNLETLVLNQMGIGVQILLKNIQSLKKLRYLEVSQTNMEELPDSVTSLCNLQTLDLNHCKLRVIPDSISGLKNLRFLNLSFNPIEELPVSVFTLSNLQALDINSCKNVKALPEYVADLANLKIFDFRNCPLLKALPEDFGTLTQLRSLDLYGTEIEVLPESCSNLNNHEIMSSFRCELPKSVENWTKLRKFVYTPRRNPIILGLGRLAFLEYLCYSVPEELIHETDECNGGIQGLGNLNFLERLTINNLQNVKDPLDAERANLKGKLNLRGLCLHWGKMEEELGMSWDQKSRNFQLLKALQPPAGLRDLGIRNFMGCDLPTWMCVPSGLPNLVDLRLGCCRRIKQLPAAIGPRLRFLTLEEMCLKSLDIGVFSSLLILILTDMLLLEELYYSFPPFLMDLRICGCKNLSELPSFTSLKVLLLEKIDHKLVSSVAGSQTSIVELWLVNIDGLIYFPISMLQNNGNLQFLRIKECNQFQGFRVIDGENENGVALYGSDLYSVSLQVLQFLDCPVVKFLPDLRGWTSLTKLVIFNCPQVKEALTYDLKSLTFLKELYVDFIQRDYHRGDPSVVSDLIELMRCMRK